MKNIFNIHILPRQVMSWEKFVESAPQCSIALDGMVLGGPRFDAHTMHVNFDHHDCVVREATLCTVMQVFYAIKGGMVNAFLEKGQAEISVYINDTDQDTAFAVWLLQNYKQFEGTQNNPGINRLLDITNKLDITGGGFPMNLRNQIMRQYNWIFKPYTELRKSGQLAKGDANVLRDNLEAVMARLDKAYLGEAGEEESDIRCEILYDSPFYKIVDEIGGNEARYNLFSHGMNAFVSIVSRRDNGNLVVSVGRRSQYVNFPVEKIYDALNKAEGLNRENGWNGSGIIGGSPRQYGTSLSWQQIRDEINKCLENVWNEKLITLS